MQKDSTAGRSVFSTRCGYEHNARVSAAELVRARYCYLAVLAVPLQSILRRYPQCLSVLDDTPQTLSVAAAICISLSQRSLRTMTVDQDLVHEAVVELLA